MSYPPQPWSLRGQLYGSVLLVPRTSFDVPQGWKVVRLCGRAVIGVVWVDYEPGGVLSYRELMTTVLVRRGLRVVPTITHIWVDSGSSRDGGRALWGIPKELAQFTFRGSELSADLDGRQIAQATIRARWRAPLRVPVRFSIVQTLRGSPVRSRVRTTASPSAARVTLRVSRMGPIGFLAGRKPLVSFGLRDFRMSFGG